MRDPGVVRGAAVRYAAELYREMRAWDAASAVVTEGLTSALIARVDFDASRAEPAPRQARGDIMRAVERLRADPCNPPSLALLAAEAGLSTISFARAFRRHFGCGVGAYLARRARGDGEARARGVDQHCEHYRGGSGLRGPGAFDARLSRRDGLDAGGVQARDGGVGAQRLKKLHTSAKNMITAAPPMM